LELDADEGEKVSEGLVDFLVIAVKYADAVAKCIECCRQQAEEGSEDGSSGFGWRAVTERRPECSSIAIISWVLPPGEGAGSSWRSKTTTWPGFVAGGVVDGGVEAALSLPALQ
jgi:hypothetical protein